MNINTLTLAILSLTGVAVWGSTTSLLDPSEVRAFTSATPDSVKLSDRPLASQATKKGSVHAIKLLDSYTWAVQSEDGTWYDPVNLPDSLKVEGASVTFSYRKTADWGYTYASGELIEITEISRTK